MTPPGTRIILFKCSADISARFILNIFVSMMTLTFVGAKNSDDVASEAGWIIGLQVH